MVNIREARDRMSNAEKILMNMNTLEGKAISNIERKYMKKRSDDVYVALEDVNFLWDLKDVELFDEMWESGKTLTHISAVFDRKLLEIALLVMDRDLKGKIKPRKTSVWGPQN